MSDYLYGINPVQEALLGGNRKPLELLLQSGSRQARLEQVESLAQKRDLAIRSLPRRELDRLVGHDRHQGVLLRIEPFAYVSLDDLLSGWRQTGTNAFFLVLDGITDPHNFGALLRTAEGAGCHGVIVAKDRACPVTAVVEKTAAGALAHLPLCQVTNLARTLEELQQQGVWCYGLAGEEGADDLFAARFPDNLALVVGSEGKGLRPNIRKHCDGLLAITMRGQVSSLNASVAAGIALFEVARRQHATN